MTFWKENVPFLFKTKQHSCDKAQLYIAVVGRPESIQPALVFASLTENEATLTETPAAPPHPHRCSYLLCLCVWCCWPPSGSPGVFYASRGDRTPYVAVDYDGEDLRKSRFAVLLRRPSFSGLLFMLALLLRLNPPFPFFTQLEQCR